MVCAAIKSAASGDKRAFASVEIQGYSIAGLLDTGASVSLLGSGGIEFLKKIGATLDHAQSTVQAAGGTRHTIVGKVEVSVG
ncbi:hypothetical protein ACLKA6_005746 [Drosophila palustris]